MEQPSVKKAKTESHLEVIISGDPKKLVSAHATKNTAQPAELLRAGSCDSLGQVMDSNGLSAVVDEQDAATQRQIAALAAENLKLKEALAQVTSLNASQLDKNPRRLDTDAGADALLALMSSAPPALPPVKATASHAKAAQPATSPAPKASGRKAPAASSPAASGATEASTKLRKRKRKEKEEALVLPEGEPELHELPPPGTTWKEVHVTLRNGKYKGRRAVVLGLAKKKYRVQVQGLEYQLEFYPSYVGLPVPPEGYVSGPSAPSPPPSMALSTQSPGGVPAASRALSVSLGASAQPGPGSSLAGGPMLLTGTGGHHYVIMPGGSSPPPPGGIMESGLPAMGRVNSMASTSSKASEAQSSAFKDKHAGWVGQTLTIQRGKYHGRQAKILGTTNAKLQVSVPGVQHQLEYYPSMFQSPPERPRTAVTAAAAQSMARDAAAAAAVPCPLPQAPVVATAEVDGNTLTVGQNTIMVEMDIIDSPRKPKIADPRPVAIPAVD